MDVCVTRWTFAGFSACIVNNMDCDQRWQAALHLSFVYSVTPLQQRPPRQQQKEKIEYLDIMTLADIGST
jgi:hypothetical protein